MPEAIPPYIKDDMIFFTMHPWTPKNNIDEKEKTIEATTNINSTTKETIAQIANSPLNTPNTL